MSTHLHVKRDLAIVIFGRILQMALLLLMLRAMTARLTPTEIGNFSLLTSIAALFEWILISPIGAFVNRHTFDWRARQTLWINYATEGAYVVAVAIFSAVAICLWALIFNNDSSLRLAWLAPALGVYIVVHCFNTTLIPSINLLGKRVAFTILYVASQLFCLGFSWWFAGISAKGEYWFLGQTAGFALGFVIALPYFIKLTAPDHSVSAPRHDTRSGLRDLTRFCFPIALTMGLNWVLFQSYRVIVGSIVSLDFLGLFFAGYTASAGVMAAVETTASQFFGPYFYKHIQESAPSDRHLAWAAYISTLYPLMIVVVMVMVALAEPITHVLLAHKFAAAAPFVAVGAIAEGIRVLANTYGLAAQTSKRTRALLPPYSVGAATTVTTLLGGTLLFGQRAVAPAIILSALLFWAAMHVAMIRHSGATLSIRGTKWVFATAFVLVLVRFIEPFMPLHGAIADLTLLTVGGLVLVGAFLLIARDTLPVLAKFSE